MPVTTGFVDIEGRVEWHSALYRSERKWEREPRYERAALLGKILDFR